MTHQKHTTLTKPLGGSFAYNEIGILGAPCGEIKHLATALIRLLSDWRIAYADAEHNPDKEAGWTSISLGGHEEWIQKGSVSQLTNSTSKQSKFTESDMAIINANHFKTETQIAWIHPKKSLENKLDKLTNVLMVIMDPSFDALPDFLSAHLRNQNVPIFSSGDTKNISEYIKSWLKDRTPPLNGLVLLGGKSIRMNRDKGLLDYHGLPQRDYLFTLLEQRCEHVYFSCRDEAQSKLLDKPCITDKFIGLGPYGGILSAFMFNPNSAWLVLAVDLPLMDDDSLNNLIKHRNIHKYATCFIDRNNEFPEPLISIWEPRSYPRLLNFLSKGYSCPRKALLNSDVEIIVKRNIKALTNVNTPEEHDIITKQLAG